MSEDAEVRKEIRRLENKANDFSKAANTRERAANKAGKDSKIYATYMNMLKQASELRQEAKQLKSTLSSGTSRGAGGGKSVVGGITGRPAGPNNPRTKLKMLNKGGSIDYRKGGMVLSTVDNRKNK